MELGELFDAGEDAFEGGNYMRASRIYSQVLEIDHEDVTALVRRAECFLHLKYIQLAMTDAHLACSLFAESSDFGDPMRVVAFHTLAKILSVAGHWDQAIELFDHLTTILPQSESLAHERDALIARANQHRTDENANQRTSPHVPHRTASLAQSGEASDGTRTVTQGKTRGRAGTRRRRRRKRKKKSTTSPETTTAAPTATTATTMTTTETTTIAPDPLQEVLRSKGVSTPSPHTYRHYHVRVVPSPLKKERVSSEPLGSQSRRPTTPGGRKTGSRRAKPVSRRNVLSKSVVHISPSVSASLESKRKLHGAGLGASQSIQTGSYMADLVSAVSSESRDARGALLKTTPRLGLHTFRQEVRASLRPQMAALFAAKLRVGSRAESRTMLADTLMAEEAVGRTAAVSLTASRKR